VQNYSVCGLAECDPYTPDGSTGVGFQNVKRLGMREIFSTPTPPSRTLRLALVTVGHRSAMIADKRERPGESPAVGNAYWL